MAIRQVRQIGDDILAKKTRIVKEITPNIIELLDDMRDTLYERNGVGIAAPQVGVLRRIAIVEHEDDFYELINPEIIACEGSQICTEACLSVLGKQGDIERPMSITVKAMNRNGEEYTVEAEGYMTSVFCHEIDHLDGVLYIDKATSIQDVVPKDDDEEWEDDYEDMEDIELD